MAFDKSLTTCEIIQRGPHIIACEQNNMQKHAECPEHVHFRWIWPNAMNNFEPVKIQTKQYALCYANEVIQKP